MATSRFKFFFKSINYLQDHKDKLGTINNNTSNLKLK